MKNIISILIASLTILFGACSGGERGAKIPGPGNDGNETAKVEKPKAPVLEELENLKTDRQKLEEEIAALEKEIKEIDQTLEDVESTLAAKLEKNTTSKEESQ